MPNLFALLVGINNYHPQSGVTSLSGCLNDVKSLNNHLQKLFNEGHRRIISLTNEQATRNAVIQAFTHLFIINPDLKKGDIVLFYFSGHGSYARTNAAFENSDSEKRDETLVLYDTQCEGNFDLADKEIALLLHKIPAGADVIAIIDSCHSGSITRDIGAVDALTLGKSKFTSPRANRQPRDLKDYLGFDDLSYAGMQATGTVEIPYTRHIVLSACDRGEVAYEDAFEPRALFTSLLVKVLESSPVNISYSELFEELYTLLRRKAQKQSPQLKVYEGFNPETSFLSDQALRSSAFHQVVQENGLWTINRGAIHGLRNDMSALKSIAVNVYVNETETRTVSLGSVGLNKSEILPPGLPANAVYKATISNVQPVITILLKGDPVAIEKWIAFTAERGQPEKIKYVTDEADRYFDYVLNFDNETIILEKNDEARMLVHGIKTITGDTISYMHACCRQVSAWHQLLQLENRNMSENQFEQAFQTVFAIEVLADAANGVWKNITTETTLCLAENEKIPRRIKVSNSSNSTWYAAVYYMSSAYAIQRRTSDIDSSKLTRDTILPGLEKTGKLSIAGELEEDVVRFKLIISKEPFLDYNIPQQSDLEMAIMEADAASDRFSSRGATRGDEEESIDQGWYAKTITIRLVRSTGRIDAGRSFSAGRLTIETHPNFSAVAGIAPVVEAGKNIHPAKHLEQIFTANGFELLSVTSGTKSAGNHPNIITFSSMENEESLRENPLIIRLDENTAKGEEQVMAVTLENGVIIPLGIAAISPDNIGSVIEIRALPGNVEEEKKKNILRAAWFCIVKIAFNKNLSKLRKIDYDKGEVYFPDANIFDEVQAATRILLLVHGIIGNSKGMAANMEFLLEKKKYDLILAYDYENLNTKIEDIAGDLLTHLQKAGIGKNKSIDIIAHSMGGLVSRYLVERLQEAEGWVNELYMFGTPNAGSSFGQIPKWRDRAIGVLTLACNFGQAFLGAVGPVLEAINKGLAATVPVTNTLAQMNDGSDFYKLLNAPPVNGVHTKYFIIAGNMRDYHPDDDGWFNNLIEKIEMQTGKWMYANIDNDIAVTVESICSAPAGVLIQKQVVACHHLNYFQEAASLDYFRSLKNTE